MLRFGTVGKKLEGFFLVFVVEIEFYIPFLLVREGRSLRTSSVVIL